MFKKNLLYLLLLFCIQCSKNKNSNHTEFENYINSKALNKQVSSGNKIDATEKLCIDQIIKAQKLSTKYDRENSESEKLYISAIAKAKKSDRKELEIWCLTQYAGYLYNFRNMPKSLPIVIRVIQDLENPETESYIIDPKNTYTFLGFYLSTIFQNDQSLVYLKKALKSPNNDRLSNAILLDNIGAINIKIKKFKEAEDYLSKALKIAFELDKKERLAKIYGNFGELYNATQNYNLAIEYLKKDIEISKRESSHQNTMYALLLLSKTYLKINEVQKAKETAEEASGIASSKIYYQSSLLEAQKILKTIAIIEKDSPKELSTQRKIDQLSLVLKDKDATETIQNSHYNALISDLKLKQEKNELRIQNAKVINKTLIFSIFATLTISLLLYINTKRRRKSEKVEYENQILKIRLAQTASEKRLAEAQHSVGSYLEFLQEKNTQIDHLKSKIKSIENKKSNIQVKRTTELQKLLESHLMTDENWFRFKNAFINQYPDYYHHLHHNFPDLTESNIRLIILLKLGISGKEIPQILGITPDAVKKAKQRLKKKFEDKFDLLFVSEI